MTDTLEVIYRVFDDSSVSRYDATDGFRSQDRSFSPEDWFDSAKMAQALRRHLNRSSGNSTPFISTSASRAQSWQEVNRRRKAGKQNVKIAVINFDALAMNGVKVDHMEALIRRVRRQLPMQYQQVMGTIEYLCLSHIPSCAIEHIYDSDKFYMEDFLEGNMRIPSSILIACQDLKRSIKYRKPKLHGWEKCQIYEDDWGNKFSDEDAALESKDWNDYLQYCNTK